MKCLEQIQALYEDYLAQVEALEQNRKLGEGIFGLKGGPADNPCHDRFAADVQERLERFVAQEPDSGELCPVLDYMYRIPIEHREEKTAYWMLLAVQRSTLALIPGLSRQDAAALRQAYLDRYPRWERLPVQKQVLSALEKTVKGKR